MSALVSNQSHVSCRVSFWTERSNLVQSLCITRNRFSVIGGWKMRHGCNDESQRGIFYAVRWKRWCVLNVWRTSRGGCEKCFFHNLWLTGPFFFFSSRFVGYVGRSAVVRVCDGWRCFDSKDSYVKFSTETRSVICSKAETGFVKCIGGKTSNLWWGQVSEYPTSKLSRSFNHDVGINEPNHVARET